LTTSGETFEKVWKKWKKGGKKKKKCVFHKSIGVLFTTLTAKSEERGVDEWKIR
jgi:hypothetical protein